MSQMNFSIELDNERHVTAAIAFLQALQTGEVAKPQVETALKEELPVKQISEIASVPVPEKTEPAETEKPKKRKRRTKAEIETEKAAESQEAEQESQNEAKAEEKSEAKEEPTITLPGLRKLANEKIAANPDNRVKIKDELTACDSPNFSLLKPEKYDQFKAFLDKL